MKRSGLHLIVIFSIMSIPLMAQTPIELGEVRWLRDIHQAVSVSKQTGKPILILFQEIPGCMTCQRYGTEVLSHPLIVESMEEDFIPLAIYNNKGGEDGRVLKSFGEPSWNNPVVRIVDAGLKDLVPRLDGNYSPAGVADQMIKALARTKKAVPGFLRLTSDFVAAAGVKQMSFGMYCFWEGEKNLGKLDGVVSTEPGFIQGQEVVRVNFDPSVISPGQLIQEARKQDCARSVLVENETDFPMNLGIKKSGPYKPDHEPQYYLRHTAWRYVPMLPIQASRLNSLLARSGDPAQVMSPKQMEFFKFYQVNPSKGDPETYRSADLKMSWKKCDGLLKKV